MKKAFVIGILLANLALLIFVGRGLCYEGGIEDISGSKYFSAVKKAIAEARESIYIRKTFRKPEAFLQRSSLKKMFPTYHLFLDNK